MRDIAEKVLIWR